MGGCPGESRGETPSVLQRSWEERAGLEEEGGYEPRLQGGERGGSRGSRRPLFPGSWPVASVARQLGRPVSLALGRELWAGVEQRREGGAVEQVNNSGIDWKLWDSVAVPWCILNNL